MGSGTAVPLCLLLIGLSLAHGVKARFYQPPSLALANDRHAFVCLSDSALWIPFRRRTISRRHSRCGAALPVTIPDVQRYQILRGRNQRSYCDVNGRFCDHGPTLATGSKSLELFLFTGVISYSRYSRF